jgi:hypothetical protein
MTEHHSAISHAAYHDLLRALQDEQASEIKGTPRLEKRDGRLYWYDMFRIGSDVRKRYLGEDTPELADRISRHKALAEASADRAAERTRLIRILRAEGFQQTDATTGSLLTAMAKSGTFRLGGTIVGTHAFRLYEGELGIRFRLADILQTDDLDIAQFERLSLAVADQVETSLQNTFQSLDFEPLPAPFTKSVWRWRQSRSNALIEFLTPSFRAEEDIRDLPALGVSAQSLHYLNYLLAHPIKAAVLYRSGVLVQIPQPERYAIHKLIVADRRRGGPDQIKSRKDRAQAAFLIRALAEDRPDELREAHEDARARGPRWGERIDSSLKRMPETAALLAAL